MTKRTNQRTRDAYASQNVNFKSVPQNHIGNRFEGRLARNQGSEEDSIAASVFHTSSLPPPLLGNFEKLAVSLVGWTTQFLVSKEFLRTKWMILYFLFFIVHQTETSIGPDHRAGNWILTDFAFLEIQIGPEMTENLRRACLPREPIDLLWNRKGMCQQILFKGLFSLNMKAISPEI